MKNYLALVIILSLNLSTICTSQIKIEPMFEACFYIIRNEWIIDNSTGNPMDRYEPQYGGVFIPAGELLHNSSDFNFDYYVSVGLRFDSVISLEFENKIFCFSDNMISNMPYMSEFYVRLYKSIGDFNIEIEHACFHPVSSEVYSLSYNIRGGYNSIKISYNMR